jgi:hypothetical protein
MGKHWIKLLLFICSSKKDHHHEFDKKIPVIRIIPGKKLMIVSEIFSRILMKNWLRNCIGNGIPSFIMQSVQNNKIQVNERIVIGRVIGGTDLKRKISTGKMRRKLDQAGSSSQSATVESDTVEIVTKRKVIQFSADEDF